jgi:GNAT superfamily N-acetyltransferase
VVEGAGAAPRARIRRAGANDAEVLADLVWRTREESVPDIPMLVHPRESVLPFVQGVLLSDFEVWFVELEEVGPVGFLALLAPDSLSQLYLLREHTGRGLGSMLVEVATRRFPGGLQLWAFQSNHRALRFYERHGFVPVRWTDGDNEEGAPDVQLAWRPPARDELAAAG